MKKLSDAKFLVDECPQSKPAGMNCPASQGGRAPKGRRGSHAYRNTTPDASMDKTSREKEKIRFSRFLVGG